MPVAAIDGEGSGETWRTHAVMLKADTRITIDRSKPINEEPDKGHNRWHPDIPPIARVKQGEVVCIESRDVFDAQLTPSSTVEDVLAINFDKLQPLTGPVYVEGAEPGDILEIDILDVEPGSFGCTVQMSLFGFLRDIYKRSVSHQVAPERRLRHLGRPPRRTHPRRALHGGHGERTVSGAS